MSYKRALRQALVPAAAMSAVARSTCATIDGVVTALSAADGESPGAGITSPRPRSRLWEPAAREAPVDPVATS